VRDTVRTRDWTVLAPRATEDDARIRRRALVAVEYEVPPFFRAIPADVELKVPSVRGARHAHPQGPPSISQEAIEHLALSPGREALILPLS
jgi:hypothetical protein